MPTSQNGYSANDASLIRSWLIPGTSRRVRLRADDCGFLLAHVAAWFDKHIESIDNDGELDDWGYAERNVRGSSTTLSNHASGTAIDLNAPEHPRGVRNTFNAGDRAKIRAHLLVYGGALRWGGDYRNTPDDMHFEIDAPYATVRRVADRLRGTAAPSTEDTDMNVNDPIHVGGKDYGQLDSLLAAIYDRLDVIYDRTALDAGRYRDVLARIDRLEGK